jgi:hypothetical protein
MIEKTLRKRLDPIVSRRRRLCLMRTLSACWFTCGLAALALWGARWLWGWTSPIAFAALYVATVTATILALVRSRRIRADYRAIARAIEQQHPDAQAMLLAAVEQEPQGPDGQFGYLQESVIGQALRHAINHDWLRAIPRKRIVLANLGTLAAFLFLMVVVSQILPATSSALKRDGHIPAGRGYHISVSPGDTSVESGTPVVILARFDGRVPPQATLHIGPADEEKQQIVLAKNLEDPVFGGIVQNVDSNMQYYIEYAGRRTRDYEISVFEYPELQRADANIVYPAYTKLPQKLIKDTLQISVIEGSSVTLTFTLNKAVAGAWLTAKDQPPLQLSVDSRYANIYTTSHTATQNQRYELHLTDAQGRANRMPPRFVIDVHKNLPPQLKPLFPNRDVQASSLEELSLEAEVLDDFGVTAYGLGYTLAGAQSTDLDLSRSALPDNPASGPRGKQQIQHVLPLEELNAQPDQLLTYYFWADDVGPDGRPRRTLSDMYFAEIRHFEEIFRESQASQSQQDQSRQQDQQQQQGRQAEQLARLQKQIINATWNLKRQADQAGRVSDPNDLEVVRGSQADALEQARSALTQAEDPPSAEALQAAAGHMETSLNHLGEATQSQSSKELTPALASEQSAYQELLKLKRQEYQVGRSQNASQNSSASARSQQQLQQLELRQQQDRYETERLAQSGEQATQREDLQAMNRLRDLARRQNEMSEKLKELEAALRQAQSEQQKQEIARELKRLREEQLDSLRDVDELSQRMESPENRQRMADSREQLQQSRSNIRRSAEELEQGMVSRAITSATRAGRELEQMQDEFRRRTSGQFTEQMRDMREQARGLDERQRQIAEELRRQAESDQKLLADSGTNAELAERIDKQKENTQELIEQMKTTSQDAETSEPLLSRKLYDTVRQAGTDNVDRALEIAGELLRRDFLPQARQIERQASEGIEQLRKGVEEAAASVLADEAEALRLARQQLDELIRQVDDEMARAGAAGRQQPGDSNDPLGAMQDQRRRADARSAPRGQGRPGDPNQAADAEADQQRLADAQSGRQGQRPTTQDGQPSTDPSEARDSTADSAQQPGSQGDRTKRPDGRNPTGEAGGRNDPTGWGGGEELIDQRGGPDFSGPLTGNDFTDWSDRMRDVEEMLTRPTLRNEVARVRDRARSMRAEFKRHGAEPQWDLVREQIIRPLTELSKNLSDELAKLQSDESLVPIDRDPVPDRFTELVRRYYENLGGGD